MRYTVSFLFACGFAIHAADAHYLPADNPKFIETKTVFDRIVRTQIAGAPELFMTPGKPAEPDDLARFQKGENRVYFSEHVYDTCGQLGGSRPDCLSVLLGHELAHHYHAHLLETQLISAGALAGPDAGDACHIRTIEADADRFGGVLAFEAGYDPAAFSEELLQQLYKDYAGKIEDENTPEAERKYPTLAIRTKIAPDTAQWLHTRLYPLFEMGARLYLLGKYRFAAACFDNLSTDFPSREILNNSAAAYLMAVLDEQPRLAGGYFYPVEFDFDTRLRPPVSSKGADDTLAQVLKNLDRALLLDSQYAPAAINKSIALSLRDDADERLEGEIWGRKASRIAKASGRDDWVSQAIVWKGVLAAKKGDKPAARTAFESAAKLGNVAAALNMKVLEGGADSVAAPIQSPKLSDAEQIAGRPVGKFAPSRSDPKLDVGKMDGNKLELSVHLAKQWNQATVLVGGNPMALIVTTAPGYEDATAKGIQAGSSEADLVAAYGKPARTYSARQGRYYLYTNPNLIVFLGPDNRVIDWSI